MWRRLGVSPGPDTFKGPVIATLVTPELLANVCQISSAPGGGFLTKATPIVVGPAFTVSFKSREAAAGTSLMRSPFKVTSSSSP